MRPTAALASDLLRSQADSGRAFAFMVLGGNVFGLLAPIVTGYIVQITGSFFVGVHAGRRAVADGGSGVVHDDPAYAGGTDARRGRGDTGGGVMGMCHEGHGTPDNGGQNFSTHGRNSTSHVQALRGWFAICQ